MQMIFAAGGLLTDHLLDVYCSAAALHQANDDLRKEATLLDELADTLTVISRQISNHQVSNGRTADAEAMRKLPLTELHKKAGRSHEAVAQLANHRLAANTDTQYLKMQDETPETSFNALKDRFKEVDDLYQAKCFLTQRIQAKRAALLSAHAQVG
jgi:hypothetical protein